jgi:hypothetical protein
MKLVKDQGKWKVAKLLYQHDDTILLKYHSFIIDYFFIYLIYKRIERVKR